MENYELTKDEATILTTPMKQVPKNFWPLMFTAHDKKMEKVRMQNEAAYAKEEQEKLEKAKLEKVVIEEPVSESSDNSKGA